eukprot:TRINITY_DN6524_c0_g1_i1.p1 TRINITY_DN6524_c0_g1~~TRINITY_DN6524_c0_g1_i1.p1  ORF type:complete len:376 (+),score=53.54 TRINITY_DN6524_c0_g1_i1:269-1396(+)
MPSSRSDSALGDKSVDYYEVLGVSSSATAAELRQAYRVQALRWHPDKNPEKALEATERFKLIAQAYSVLRDEKQRSRYDSSRRSNIGFTPPADADAGSSFNTAKDLFSEIFGEELAAGIGRVASIASSTLSEAANLCSRHQVTRGAVVAGLQSMRDVASAEAFWVTLLTSTSCCYSHKVEKWETALTRCQNRYAARQEEYRDLDAVFVTQTEVRKSRSEEAWQSAVRASLLAAGSVYSGMVCSVLPSWLMSMVMPSFAAHKWPLAAFWFVTSVLLVVRGVGRWEEVFQRSVEADRRAANEKAELQELLAQVHSAAVALETASDGLKQAQVALRHAQKDIAAAEASGASIGSAVKIGMHFCGRIFGAHRNSNAELL